MLSVPFPIVMPSFQYNVVQDNNTQHNNICWVLDVINIALFTYLFLLTVGDS